jgi:hypothetical protein
MNQTVTDAAASPAAKPPLTPGKGLIALLAIIVLVALYLWLAHSVGVAEVWPGMLFVLYWAALEHVQMDRLVPSAVGALCGLALAFSLEPLPRLLGDMGWAVFLALVLIAVYCHVMKWLTTVVNLAFMLYLTVGTIPVVQQHADHKNAFGGLLFGIVFMVVLVVGGKWVAAKFAKRAA